MPNSPKAEPTLRRAELVDPSQPPPSWSWLPRDIRGELHQRIDWRKGQRKGVLGSRLFDFELLKARHKQLDTHQLPPIVEERPADSVD